MSTFSFQIHPSFRPKQQPRIDRANNRLYGIVAGMDVEATGHGVCCDVKSLELIAQLANAKLDGVSGRFGHPGMSENATGRKVQLAYHWRIRKGEKAHDPHTYLVHDSLLMDAARTSPAFAQDPIEYILNMAEQQPRQFAESLVLTANQIWTTKDGQELPIWEEVEDEDGYKYKRVRKRPENALTRVPVLRPTAVHFCDFVNEGAITHSGLYPMSDASLYKSAYGLDSSRLQSIFTEEAGSNYLLDHLFATVDDLCHRFHISLDAIRPKALRLLRLYIDSRSAGEGEASPQPLYFEGSPLGTPVAPPLAAARKEEDVMTTRRHRSDRKLRRTHGIQRTPLSEVSSGPLGPDTSRLSQGEPRNRVRHAFTAKTDEGDVGLPLGLDEQEELQAETEAALDNADAILNQAEAMANSIVQSTAALSAAPTLATAAQVAHLQEQLDQHTDQLHELTHQLRKLSELLVKNMELTAALQRNIARANGETVITQRVPLLGATGALEGFSFQQPAPGNWAVTQQPVSTDQRRDQLPSGLDPEGVPLGPEARAIRANQRRAQQTRQ